MPLLQVTLVAGRSPARKRELIVALTEAVVDTLDAPRDTVRVIINEVPPEHWAVGGVPKSGAGERGPESDRSSR